MCGGTVRAHYPSSWHLRCTLTHLSSASREGDGLIPLPATLGLHPHPVKQRCGANDVGALKAAMVGVSLSESEASIAAPFTYQRPNIECIPPLLSEGRSSLVTSFQLFRYISMYSLTQFGAAILTYFVGSVLGNWQYLYQDLIVVFPLLSCHHTVHSEYAELYRKWSAVTATPWPACAVGRTALRGCRARAWRRCGWRPPSPLQAPQALPPPRVPRRSR